MNRRSSRINRLKLETSGELPIVLEEFILYTSNKWRHQNRKMSTCNRLDRSRITRFLTDRLCPKASGTLGRILRSWHHLMRERVSVRRIQECWNLVCIPGGSLGADLWHSLPISSIPSELAWVWHKGIYVGDIWFVFMFSSFYWVDLYKEKKKKKYCSCCFSKSMVETYAKTWLRIIGPPLI